MAGDEDSEKKPRGIRFTDEGYNALKNASRGAGHRHIDTFVAELIAEKKKRASLGALLRENRRELLEDLKRELPAILEASLKKFT